MLIAPSLHKKIGLKNAMLFGALMQSLGTYVGSMQTTLLPFLFWYSCVFGTGIGLAYTAPLILGFKWFPTRKGMVSGIILAGFGLGGFFFNKLGSMLANPEGVEVGTEAFRAVYGRFPIMLKKLRYARATLLELLKRVCYKDDASTLRLATRVTFSVVILLVCFA